MNTTDRIEKTKKLATELHAEQFRKDGVTPYISHLLAVADILSEYTNDEDVIIAGLMHDSIEDVKDYTYERLVGDCGKSVADMVEGVTQERWIENKEIPRDLRVKMYEEMLLRNVDKIKRGGDGSILIACADKIHNLSSILDGVNKNGIEYLDRFREPIKQKVWYYGKVLEMAKQNINGPILQRLEDKVVEAKREFNITSNYET
ncbi:MAG: HD domain-containing protein, partial [Minisyncoccia bacterium]